MHATGPPAAVGVRPLPPTPTRSRRQANPTPKCHAQALFHSPVLLPYHLTGGHPRDECELARANEPCLICELVRAGLGGAPRRAFAAMTSAPETGCRGCMAAAVSRLCSTLSSCRTGSTPPRFQGAGPLTALPASCMPGGCRPAMDWPATSNMCVCHAGSRGAS